MLNVIVKYIICFLKEEYMLKKLSLFAIFFLLSFSFLVSQELSQEYEDDNTPFKMVFGEIGYGTRELSIGVGFRWNFLSLDLNLGGVVDNTPNYIYPQTEFPYPKQFDEYRYPRTTITINASYYYDIDDFSIFATIGYFNQTDSLLVRSLEQGNTNGVYFAKQGNPAENSGGVCFGLGGEYFINEKFVVGAGYHTKKGAFVQFGYYWY